MATTKYTFKNKAVLIAWLRERAHGIKQASRRTKREQRDSTVESLAWGDIADILEGSVVTDHATMAEPIDESKVETHKTIGAAVS